MATRTIIIDSDDREHFFLAVDGTTLTIGDTPAHGEGVLHGLRIARIHCEVEVEDDGPVALADPANGSASPKEITPGGVHQLGHAHLMLVNGPQANGHAEPLPPSQARRLFVVNGADQGRSYGLPTEGIVRVGKSEKHADVVLHDLYLSRVQCEVRVDANGVTVSHVEGDNGTLIDGRKIDGPQVLWPGSVLRVGNSHLRLEVGVFEESKTDPKDEAGYEVVKSSVARPSVAGPPSSMIRRPLDPLEGQTFSHYRLGSVIGKGHTSTVYQGTDLNSRQLVAVKVFPGEFPAANAELERFALGFKAASQVQHPNLVALLGAGKTGPHCWIAREYVDGESAADLIQKIGGGEKPSWTRAARVAIHLARALEGLHEHHVVHGNITPRNVLIGKGDVPTKLADLGLSKALDESKLLKAVMEKKLLAEMAYLAPEQTDSDAFVDDLADMYAVGAVAYALVAGRPPFMGDTPEALLDQIQTGRVTKPSTYHKKTPAAFDAIVLKLLSRHQEDRYPSPEKLLIDLEPLVKAHEVKA